MAAERDLELLDDYLADRMGADSRSAFEKKLHGDPALRSEYELQRAIVEGIRQNRVAELKAMLNKVPVPSHGGKGAGHKIAIAATLTAIAAGTLWYTNNEEPAPTVVLPDATVTEPVTPENAETTPVAPETTPPAREPRETPTQKQEAVRADKNQTSAGTENSRPALAQKPVPPAGPPARPTEIGRNVETIVITSNQKDFHYQFIGGKLHLYGPFDSDSVRIHESPLRNDSFPVLEYNNRYYLLRMRDGETHPLEPVTDPDDLEKLGSEQKQ